jgi:hypothetical protein
MLLGEGGAVHQAGRAFPESGTLRMRPRSATRLARRRDDLFQWSIAPESKNPRPGGSRVTYKKIRSVRSGELLAHLFEITNPVHSRLTLVKRLLALAFLCAKTSKAGLFALSLSHCGKQIACAGAIVAGLFKGRAAR